MLRGAWLPGGHLLQLPEPGAQANAATPSHARRLVLGGRFEDLDGDVNFAADGVRVGASAIGEGDQPFPHPPIFDPPPLDVELRPQTQTLPDRADSRHFRYDRI